MRTPKDRESDGEESEETNKEEFRGSEFETPRGPESETLQREEIEMRKPLELIKRIFFFSVFQNETTSTTLHRRVSIE